MSRVIMHSLIGDRFLKEFVGHRRRPPRRGPTSEAAPVPEPSEALTANADSPETQMSRREEEPHRDTGQCSDGNKLA